MIHISHLKKLSSNESNTEELEKKYYHIFDNVNMLNNSSNINTMNLLNEKSVLNNKLEKINIKELEYIQRDFINYYDTVVNNNIPIDIISDEKKENFKIININNIGNIPYSLSTFLKNYFKEINFQYISVPNEDSIYYALLNILDSNYINKIPEEQLQIINNLKNKLLLELSGDKLFSYFKISKHKINIEDLNIQFKKKIVSESVLVVLEKYFNVNFIIYNVETKNFIERNIVKISPFHIILKYKNTYYPVINNLPNKINVEEHPDFLNKINYFTIYKKEEINDNTNYDKMKIKELIEVAKKYNIDYEYIDPNTKKIKNLTKSKILENIKKHFTK
jgi:hypothetical protein